MLKLEVIIFVSKVDLWVYNKLMNVKELAKLQEYWVAFSADRKTVIDKSKTMLELLNKVGDRKDVVISFIERRDRFISP